MVTFVVLRYPVKEFFNPDKLTYSDRFSQLQDVRYDKSSSTSLLVCNLMQYSQIVTLLFIKDVFYQ